MEIADPVAGAVVEVVRVDADPVIRDSNRPEEATGRNARAHVVDLMRVGRQRVYDQTRVKVKSYEAEGSFVLLSVDADVLAAHEPVVAVEEQRLRIFGLRIPARTCAPDGRDPGGAAVVEDRARLNPWTEERVIAGEESTRNRNRIPPGRVDERREQHQRPGHGGGGDARGPKKLSTRHRALPEMLVSHVGMAGHPLPHAVTHIPNLLERHRPPHRLSPTSGGGTIPTYVGNVTQGDDSVNTCPRNTSPPCPPPERGRRSGQVQPVGWSWIVPRSGISGRKKLVSNPRP